MIPSHILSAFNSSNTSRHPVTTGAVNMEELEKKEQSYSKERKMLKLENGEIKVVPLKETTLFERVQAWFGYGPLSLKNIGNHIVDNGIDLSVSDLDKQTFYKKFFHLCSSRNSHSIRKIDLVGIQNLAGVSFQRDATYKTDGKGIDDVSYANLSYNFGYVADGTGHGNEMMAPVLDRIFSNFNQAYIASLKEKTPSSEEDYKKFVAEELKKLGDAIHCEKAPVEEADSKRPGMTHMDEPTLKPAFSFAQIVTVRDQRLLISVQYSDTMLLIKKANGEFDVSLAKSKTDYGLGARNRPVDRIVEVTPLDRGDVVYGFSDGIGEFLTMKQCQEIISQNKKPSELLSELKKEIVGDPDRKGVEKQEKSANGKKLKYHDWNDKHCFDDISMFSLTVD